MSELPKIIVGIPGTWTDRSAIVEAIAKQSDGYLFAGMTLMNIQTKWSCTIEVYDNDPRLRKAFEVAGDEQFDKQLLDQIDGHTHTIYLVTDGGSPENARAVARAANALLDCGGLAVKVESAGIAHTPVRWRELTELEPSFAMLYAFVTYAGDHGSYYSCGMHNIGHRDAVVTGELPPREATDLLFAFNKYIAIENVVIADGETFGTDAQSPRFRVNKTDCTEFSADNLFYNPYGVYSLTFA